MPTVGFVFSTKDRVPMTHRSLASIDTDGGFDLIWVDGSQSPEGQRLPLAAQLRRARLVEICRGVTGGPDAAIRY